MTRVVKEHVDASIGLAGSGWATVNDVTTQSYASGFGGVTSAAIMSGGAYSAAPTGVTFTAANGVGSGATGGTVTTSGVSPNIAVTGFTVTAPGTLYQAAPVIAFTGGTAVTPALAVARSTAATYAATSHAGDVAVITVPTGVTGVLLTATRTGSNNVVSVAVDGVAQPTWNQSAFTTNAGATWSGAGLTQPVGWYQSCYQPIRFANTAITHTITLGIVSGTLALDSVEFYTSAATTAGKLLSAGHSIPAGAQLGSPGTQRFGALVAAFLGMTETNTAVGTTALHLGSSAVQTAQYVHHNGVGTWWDQTPEIALLMHGRNDVFFFSATDPGGGLGYDLEAYKQRIREDVWRMNLNSPNTLVVLCGIAFEDLAAQGRTAVLATEQAYDAALASLVAEGTFANTLYVPTWPVIANGGGGALLDPTDHTHPLATGHQMIAREIVAAVRAARLVPATRFGVI
jgi:lysophospholipase L1-like esterase